MRHLRSPVLHAEIAITWGDRGLGIPRSRRIGTEVATWSCRNRPRSAEQGSCRRAVSARSTNSALADNVLLRRFSDIDNANSWREREPLDVQSGELEAMVLGAVAFGRSGPTVAWFAEIVDAHPEFLGFRSMTDPLRYSIPLGRDVVQAGGEIHRTGRRNPQRSGRSSWRRRKGPPAMARDPRRRLYISPEWPSPRRKPGLNWNVMHRNSSGECRQAGYAATAA
jgi:hypothetical protein